MIRSLNIGGVILSPLGRVSDAKSITRLQEEVPLLLFDSHIAGLEAATLTCDNSQGIGLIVDHLCATGTAPCYVDMPEINSTGRERREAYEAAMRARGFAPHVLPSPEAGWGLERIGAEVARAALAAGGFPSSTVLCGNDRLAIGVLSVLHKAGIKVGRDGALRVAGHDDHPAAAYACPSLTTVAQDTAGLARRAIGMTLDMIAKGGPTASRERLPSALVLRDSA